MAEAATYRTSIEIALETTFGTKNASPTFSILPCADLQTPPLSPNYGEYSHMTGSIDVNPKEVISNFHKFTGGKAYLTGGGDSTALDTEPFWGIIAEILGYEKVVTADTSVAYRMKTVNQKSATVRIYKNGVVKIEAEGCVATKADFVLTAGALPMLEFDLAGKYSDPTDATPGTLSYSQIPRVFGVNSRNTTATIHGVSGIEVSEYRKMSNILQTAEIDNINETQPRNIDSSPMDQITIVASTLADLNYIDKATNGTAGALSVVHGSGGGNIITFAHTETTLSFTGETNADGRDFYQFDVQNITDSNGYHGTITTT